MRQTCESTLSSVVHISAVSDAEMMMMLIMDIGTRIATHQLRLTPVITGPKRLLALHVCLCTAANMQSYQSSHVYNVGLCIEFCLQHSIDK